MALVNGNAQNSPGGTVPRNRSRFPLSYSFFDTDRFAEYKPFFVMEGVDTDKFTLNSSHEVRTYTLKSPIMQSLLKKKDYFNVPMTAILPLNWEKFYTNPVIGEDVPDDVGCGVKNFWNQVYSMFTAHWNELSTLYAAAGDVDGVDVFIRCCFRFLVFYERFYSNGSLMSSLGIHGANYVRVRLTDENIETSFDFLFDTFCENFIGGLRDLGIDVFRAIIGNDDYEVHLGSSVNVPATYDRRILHVTFREFLDALRDDEGSFSYFSTGVTDGQRLSSFTQAVWDYSFELFTIGNPIPPSATDSEIALNLSRLWAYQLVCAHFYSNDHVDFVYSAELFRQYIWHLYRDFVLNLSGVASIDDIGFSVNGFKYEYDACSSFVASTFLTDFPSLLSPYFINFSPYWRSLLGYNRSLRFMDYFSGSRTRPLAVGDASIDASAGSVSVLDMSRKMQMTRFYNAVNRTGRKFSNYMKELFGKTPNYDYHNPLYLAHTSDVVGSTETNSTAENQFKQNAISSNLRSNASRYAFSFEPDRDCIVIGITYYDIPRVYTRSTERQAFHVTRFDMFNPFLQFIGDQEIYTAEIGVPFPSMAPFAYTNRDMEYKQRYNQAAGGFCEKSTQLGSWIFSADELRRGVMSELNSDFIRSFNSELDRFYSSLTGYSLGTYFHFIVRNDNKLDASRPMAYNPSIL